MIKKKNDAVLSSSFRDPSGFVYKCGGKIYRQVNQHYKKHFDALMKSGLYKKLMSEGLLVSHKDVEMSFAITKDAYKVILPEQLPIISYPYEWCFTQYKDAALATLAIQQIAFEHGMILKDATAYNIQFFHGRPVLIDTLSFEIYEEGVPWIAYRQFCQHFLAPLALASKVDVRLLNLMKIYIDGIPLDLASGLLPLMSRLNPALFAHLHVHAQSQKRYADNKISFQERKPKMSKVGFKALVDNLQGAVRSLKLKKNETEWAEYYTFTNYTDVSFRHKKQLVEDFLDAVQPDVVWDLGANNGEFSRIASDKGIYTVAWDIDPLAVEYNYDLVKKNSETALLPLVLDLGNPSPGIGWAHMERASFVGRATADMVWALALVHHLRITANIPLVKIAEFFSQLGKYLVIEFVPKDDSQTEILLKNREDIFSDYYQSDFERIFARHYDILKKEPIKETKRTLYLMKAL